MKLRTEVNKIKSNCRACYATSITTAANSLITYLGYDPEIETITYQTMDNYRGWLAKKRLSVATQKTYLNTLATLFNKFVDNGLLNDNPLKLVKIPKPQQRVKAISPDHQLRMIAAAKINLRDYAILRLYASTGARLSEFVELRVKDIEIGETIGKARIIGKGIKERSIFFTEETAHALTSYLHWRNARPHDPLFTQLYHDKKISAKGISEIFNRYGRLAQIPKPYNPHSYRHAFAKALIKNGADIRTVCDLMGHSDPAFTARVYLKWTEEELAERYKMFSPL